MNAEQIHNILTKAYDNVLRQADIRQEGKPQVLDCDLGLDRQQEQAFADFFNKYVRKASLDAAKLHGDAVLVALSEYLASQPGSK